MLMLDVLLSGAHLSNGQSCSRVKDCGVRKLLQAPGVNSHCRGTPSLNVVKHFKIFITKESCFVNFYAFIYVAHEAHVHRKAFEKKQIFRVKDKHAELQTSSRLYTVMLTLRTNVKLNSLQTFSMQALTLLGISFRLYDEART